MPAGHEVLGLARSEASAAALDMAGADVLRGSLEDTTTLRAGAGEADGVLHLAMARGDVAFAEALEIDRRALVVLGSALEGTDRPLVFASATSMIEPGRVITEEDAGDTMVPGSRGRAEDEVLELAGRGVRVAVVRLATLVHADEDRHGFLPMLIETARARGSRPTSAPGAIAGPGFTGSTPPA